MSRRDGEQRPPLQEQIDRMATQLTDARIGVFVLIVAVSFLFAVGPCQPAHAAPRSGSYAKQSSSGAPLVVAGRIDTAAVRLLARFDDVTLELTPFAQNVDGSPRADVPLMLRRLNPNIRLWLYVLAGDQWLPPTFRPQPTDRSGFRDVFDAVNGGNGWLYDTAGNQWMPDGQKNYRVNLGDYRTVWAMGDVYLRALSTHLFDGIFLDCAHTSIAWTSKPGRELGVERAGFRSLAAMDSARLANVELLIRRLHAANPCLLVALNGTGPRPAGLDVDFKEGFGSLITFSEARRWLHTPGRHWLKAECWNTADCERAVSMMKSAALGNPNVILSAGPDREWEPREVR